MKVDEGDDLNRDDLWAQGPLAYKKIHTDIFMLFSVNERRHGGQKVWRRSKMKIVGLLKINWHQERFLCCSCCEKLRSQTVYILRHAHISRRFRFLLSVDGMASRGIKTEHLEGPPLIQSWKKYQIWIILFAKSVINYSLLQAFHVLVWILLWSVPSLTCQSGVLVHF